MSDQSTIQWTDATWNPVTGCTKISPGCAHCYIERTVPFRVQGRRFDKGRIPIILHADRLGQPLKWKTPKRVFVNSLSDLFHEGVPDDFIDEVFGVMGLCEDRELGHVFQVLTKRPARMLTYMQQRAYRAWNSRRLATEAFPPRNVWIGVSVEDQQRADERIPLLLQTPAALRFLSCEPLLGPIRLPWNCCPTNAGDPSSCMVSEPSCLCEWLHWVIIGGESGPGARPCNVAWIRSLVAQCRAAGVAPFVKQIGSHVVCANYEVSEWFDRCGHLDNRATEPIYQGRVDRIVGFRDWRHGGDQAEWPADMRVREYPRMS